MRLFLLHSHTSTDELYYLCVTSLRYKANAMAFASNFPIRKIMENIFSVDRLVVKPLNVYADVKRGNNTVDQFIFSLDGEGFGATKKRKGKGSAYQTISATHKVQIFLFTPLGLFNDVNEFFTILFHNDDA